MSRPDFSLATLNWGNPELLTPSSAQPKPLGHWELTEGGRRGEGSVRTARQEGTASLQQQHELRLPQRNPQPIAPVPTGFHTDQQYLLQEDHTLITQQAQPVLALPQGPQSTSRAGRGSRSSCHHAVPGWFWHSTTSTARARC